VAETGAAALFSFAPNPCRTALHVCPRRDLGRCEVTVFDVTGRPVVETALAEAGINLDLSGHAPGSYVVVLRTRTRQAGRHVVLLRY